MNPDFGTNAQAYKTKRVMYEGTGTIRMGMPLCYNHDTTTNILGSNKADGTRGTTTADGYQNEGKVKRVEAASAANQRFFAGVVSDAKDLNQAGSGSSWVDIYVPNGAIVPVHTDKNVSNGDGAYLEPGELTVINAATAGGVQVGWFMETIDRSSTAGLAFVKLMQPEMSAWAAATTLGKGYSPLLWGDCPITEIEADPGNGYIYKDDFLNWAAMPAGDASAEAPGWTVTEATAGTIENVIGEGGELHIGAAATADQGLQAQLLSCCVKPVLGTNIWFEARVQISHIDNQYFVGLADTDTSIIASGALDETNVESVGFFQDEPSATGVGGTVTQKTGAADVTEDIVTLTAATWTTLGFKITGVSKVEFYQDGALIETGATAANIPAVEMALSLVCQNEDGANINTLKMDWFRLAVDKRV